MGETTATALAAPVASGADRDTSGAPAACLRREAQFRGALVSSRRDMLPTMKVGEYLVEPLDRNDRVWIYRAAKKYGTRLTLRRCASRWMIMRVPDNVTAADAST